MRNDVFWAGTLVALTAGTTLASDFRHFPRRRPEIGADLGQRMRKETIRSG